MVIPIKVIMPDSRTGNKISCLSLFILCISSINKTSPASKEDKIEAAYNEVPEELVEVIRKSLVNVKAFHEKQVRNTWIDTKPDGSILGQRISPIESAGTYVPGGKAAYPSSVLMNIIPAKVAGVERIIMVLMMEL